MMANNDMSHVFLGFLGSRFSEELVNAVSQRARVSFSAALDSHADAFMDWSVLRIAKLAAFIRVSNFALLIIE